MIRVNLAKTHSYQGTVTQASKPAIELSLGSGELHPLAKIALISALTISLIVYESITISRKKAVFAEKSVELTKLQEEVQAFGGIVAVVEELAKQRQELNAQLDIINQISQKRAFKLRAIRQIQMSVPEDLWMTSIKVEQEQIICKGYSRTPTSVQKIVKSMNQSQVIESALNKELKKVKYEKDEVNEFEIEAMVKKQ